MCAILLSLEELIEIDMTLAPEKELVCLGVGRQSPIPCGIFSSVLTSLRSNHAFPNRVLQV